MIYMKFFEGCPPFIYYAFYCFSLIIDGNNHNEIGMDVWRDEIGFEGDEGHMF